LHSCFIDGKGDAHRGLAAFEVEDRAGVGERPGRDFLLAVVGNSRLFIEKQPSIHRETAVYSWVRAVYSWRNSHLFMKRPRGGRRASRPRLPPHCCGKQPSIHRETADYSSRNSRLFIEKQPSVHRETAVYSSRDSRLFIEKQPSIHG